ncbi:MAG: InlB B-repeat-containing protein, partial [Clostridia bacterium]|nr:InlB B-repeat-containing protein [Clostridia bacterium]
MQVNTNKKKSILIAAMVLTIMAIITVGTYALVLWGSEENTSVTIRIGEVAGVFFDSGPNINVSDMGPIFDYEKDGANTNFTVTNYESTPTTINGYLNVNTISESLKTDDFKFAVMSTTDNVNDPNVTAKYELVSEGDFKEAENGESVPLFTNEAISGNGIVNYKVIIYIDGNEENALEMQGQGLDGVIAVETGDVGVEYNANGGTGAPDFQKRTGSTITLSSDVPKKEAFTFMGWNTKPDGTGSSYAAGQSITITKSIKLYAMWKGTPYKVNYYVGNGTTTEGATLIGSTTCDYKGECGLDKFEDLGTTFPNSEGTDNNYHWQFAGWTTTEKGTEVLYKDEEEFVYQTQSDINLYAVGKKTFSYNSGNAPTKELKSLTQYWNPYSTDEIYLSSIVIPKEEKIKGWTFVGYLHGSNESTGIVTYTKEQVGTEIKPAYNVLSTARSVYEREIKLTFDANGGNGTVGDLTKTQYYNSGYASNGSNVGSNTSAPTFTLPTGGYTKAGSTLSGWNDPVKNKNYNLGVTYKDYNPGVNEKETTNKIKAVWGKNEFVVNYYLGNGTTTPGSTKIGSTTCKVNQECTLSAFTTFNKTFPSDTSGWTFYGWSRTEGGTTRIHADGEKITETKAEDINLYALAERTISFYTGNTPSSALTTAKQYWNPYASSTDYLTKVTLPTPQTLASWTFTGYLEGSNVASSNVTFTADKVGLEVIPEYNFSTAFRSVYERTLTLKFNTAPGTGTIPDLTAKQYYNSGYAVNLVNVGGNKTTPTYILPSVGVTPPTGFTWEGWKDGEKVYDIGATYSEFSPEVSDTTITKTFTAKYDAIPYNVNLYLGNGTSTDGSTLIKTITCYYGIECTLPTFSTLGKTFPQNANGWAFEHWTQANNTTTKTYSDGGKFTSTSLTDINLWAVGKRTFKFYSGVGAATSDTTKTQMWNPHTKSTLSEVTLPTATSISSWTFRGWLAGSNTASSNVTWSSSSTKVTPSHDVNNEIRAVYNRTLTITFNGNGATSGSTANITATQYYNSGKTAQTASISTPSFTLPACGFAKTGYTFSKWAVGSATGTQYS